MQINLIIQKNMPELPNELMDIILNYAWNNSEDVIPINKEIAENIKILNDLQTALGNENSTFSLAMDGDYDEEKKCWEDNFTYLGGLIDADIQKLKYLRKKCVMQSRNGLLGNHIQDLIKKSDSYKEFKKTIKYNVYIMNPKRYQDRVRK